MTQEEVFDELMKTHIRLYQEVREEVKMADFENMTDETNELISTRSMLEQCILNLAQSHSDKYYDDGFKTIISKEQKRLSKK